MTDLTKSGPAGAGFFYRRGWGGRSFRPRFPQIFTGFRRWITQETSTVAVSVTGNAHQIPGIPIQRDSPHITGTKITSWRNAFMSRLYPTRFVDCMKEAIMVVMAAKT